MSPGVGPGKVRARRGRDPAPVRPELVEGPLEGEVDPSQCPSLPTLRVQSLPQALPSRSDPACHLPLPRTPPIPYPTPMSTHTRLQPWTDAFDFVLLQIESRAWRPPSQLRIRNPKTNPRPICAHIRFPSHRRGASAPPVSTAPVGATLVVARPQSGGHWGMRPHACWLFPTPLFSAHFPICDSPHGCSALPPPRGLSLSAPATQTPRPRHNPKLHPHSNGHSIDAIPSCARFAPRSTPFKLQPRGRGTQARAAEKKRVPQFQSTQTQADRRAES